MLKTIMFLALVLFLVGCSQSLYNRGQRLSDEGQYDSAINTLYQEIKIHPQNADAWRELGIAFYKKGDITKATDALQQANNIKPDAKTNLFIGLIHEKQNEDEQAIVAYRAALGLKPKSKIKKMLRTRLDKLISGRIKKEVSFALENESKINADTIPNNTIAVVDFDNEHLPPELKPISKGLAEFTAMDLAKIPSLKVVDRLKINTILNELRLSTSGYIAPESAPRLGRLIGSQRIVTGSLVGLGDNIIRLDGAIVNTRDSVTETTKPTEASPEKFFQLQKAFVFDIIDDLGIKLTATERNAIEEVPTESYIAFMAYCRGLDFESKGMHTEAKKQFGIAVRNDVSFKQAKVQKETAERHIAEKTAPTQTVEQFEAEVISVESQTTSGEGLDDFQTTNLNLSGFINSGPYGSVVYSPLRTIIGENAVIIIRGGFNADN